ncbi:MAG: TorF family putative porin [Candidatus Omnitrophota bacterium]
MFKKICGFMMVLFLSFCFISFVYAESEGLLSDIGFEVSGDASVYSQYIWRGFVLDRDAVIQPSIYVSTPSTKFGKLKVGVWSNQDLQNSDNLKSEEFDYIIDYTYDFDYLSVSLGHTYYDFVETSTFSKEFYIGLSLPKLFLSPSVYFYRDYGSTENGGGSGNYTVINGFYSLPIKNTPLSLDFSGHVGFNHNQFIDGDGGDVGLKVGLTMPLTKNLSFTPNVNYSIPFGDLADEAHGNQKSRFFGGGTLVYKF